MLVRAKKSRSKMSVLPFQKYFTASFSDIFEMYNKAHFDSLKLEYMKKINAFIFSCFWGNSLRGMYLDFIFCE
jgi:hypothetical protein